MQLCNFGQTSTLCILFPNTILHLWTSDMRFYFIYLFLGLKLCEMVRPRGIQPMPNLACFNIAIFSIISALSVGPAVKFLPS